MADINNFTEIAENFDTIKTLLNSIRAQGILNTSDVDKLLAGINAKLEKLNTEEDIDLIKIFLSDLKKNLEERHSVLLSKFGAIESLFSNLLKNSSETLKSSEVKELFDIVATNLSVFSREVVSQKETLSDITLRLDAMRSDDSQKKEIVKNISFLKNDLERLTNGFDSIVLSLNENFKTVIKSISSVDPSEVINNFGKELEDITNSSNTILSAIQMLDKKSNQIEDTLKGLATQEDLISTKKWISDLAAQEQLLTQSIDNLSDRYYKIDNLAEKIDASVDIIAGLKTIISDKNEQGAAAVIDRLNQLEEIVKNVSSDKEFDEFKQSLESSLNNIYSTSVSLQAALNDSKDELNNIYASIQALDINVSFKSLAADLNKSEQNIKDHISTEADKIIQLVDVNATRTLNELSNNADNLSEKLAETQTLISGLCRKSFSDLEDNISGLKSIVSQIDENNVSANNAIFSNITDRLALFETSLKTSLEKQEDYVANSAAGLVEQIKNIKDLAGVLDYKLDSSVIEINNSKTEFTDLKKAVDEVLALDFVTKVNDLKVDLFAVKQDLLTFLESSSGEFSDKFSNDLFSKYELLISKLDIVEDEVKQAQTDSLTVIKEILANISSSIVDILSYVSSDREISTEAIENKLDNISKALNDNGISYIENVKDAVEVARVQVENDIKSLQEDTYRQLQSLNSAIETSSEVIREDIKHSYDKLIEVQKSFNDINDTLKVNNSTFTENISGVLQTASNLKDDFEGKLSSLKSAILEKVADFQKEFTCENADKISEIKFASESMHAKQIQSAQEIKDELKTDIAELVDSLKICIEKLSESLAGTSLKVDNLNQDIVRADNELTGKLSVLKSDIIEQVTVSQNELAEDNAQRLSVMKSEAEKLQAKQLQSNQDMRDELKGEIAGLAGSLKLSIEELSELLVGTTAKIGSLNDNIVNIVKDDFASKVENSVNNVNNSLHDFSDAINNKFDDSVSKLNELDGSINALTNTTTTALTSTLAKILDNFVALKALLGSFNDNNSEKLQNAVETIISDFANLREKIEFVDTNIDEDLTRQLSIIESNFVSLNQSLEDQFKQSTQILGNTLNDGLVNVSESLRVTVVKGLEQYKNQIDTVFANVSDENNKQLKLMETKVLELNDILQKNLAEQNSKSAAVLSDITENMKNILSENIELSNADYNALKENLDNFVKSLQEQNSVNVEHLKLKLGDIAKLLDVGLNTQVQEINKKFNELTLEVSEIAGSTAGLNNEITNRVSSISDEINVIKSDLSLVLNDVSESVSSKLKALSEAISTEYSNLLTSVTQSTSEAADAVNDNLCSEIQKTSEVLNTVLLELKEQLENTAEVQQNNLVSQICSVVNEIKILSQDAENKAAQIKQAISGNIADEMKGLFDKINALLEEHSLNLETLFKKKNSTYIEELNLKALELKNNFEALNERLDKDEISRMNVFQAQLNDLSSSFNVLIEEAKVVTKNEVSSISETLINNNREAISDIELSIEDKINSILAASADIAAGELQTMEIFTNRIIEQVKLSQETVKNCQDFINDFVKGELEVISGNIEKETDVLVKDLLEQMSIIKDFQRDELSKLATQIEASVEDYIYTNISELKSYLDVKSDTSILNGKLDSISTDLSRTAEDILAASNKLLTASVFDNAMADMKTANNVLISTMAENLNSRIQNFVKSDVISGFDERFNLFDKKFVDTVVDKYEEIKLISSKYNNSFETIQASVSDLLSKFTESKEEIYKTLLSVVNGISSEIDELNLSFANLKEQILSKSFDEAFQSSLKAQIEGIENLVKEQLGYVEDISDLCCSNLPELTEMNALIKYNIIQSVDELKARLDNKDSVVVEELNTLKTDIITQFLNIFNQISFVAEQEEILDFIQEKHSELITVLSHIVTSVEDIGTVKDNVVLIDNKVDSIRDDIDLINEKITSIISSDGDIDYVYSLQDLESDIANLRLTLNELKDNNKSKELEELIASTNNIYSLVDSLRNEFPKFDSEEFKKDFEALNEDIVSISTRTNKLILASDESYKTLQENLQDFKLVINDLDERTRNFAHEAGIDRIDNKLGVINSMIQNGAKTNQVFNQVFEYLAEWVDNAGAQISAISDKVETLDDIGQIKVMLEDLKAEAEDDSESAELIEALSNVFERQAKKISSLEAKLDRVIVETTISNKNNKVDLTPFEETLNRFLVAIDDKMLLQQSKIDSLESKLESAMSVMNPKDTAQLTKKVGGMDRQIAKLNKSIEKIASHVVEK